MELSVLAIQLILTGTRILKRGNNKNIAILYSNYRYIYLVTLSLEKK